MPGAAAAHRSRESTQRLQNPASSIEFACPSDGACLRYSIIIPAYNERLRIADGLDKVISYIAQERWDAEVIVVDDGSTDETAAIVRDYMARHAILRLVENPGNKGKGYAVRNGMMAGRGELLLLTDADLSAPIYEAKKLFAEIEKGYDVAIGSRWQLPNMQLRRQPLYRQITGRIFNAMNRLVLGLAIHDTQCGFKVFTRRAAKAIFPVARIERWGWDPEVLFLSKRMGYRISEVPVEWSHDPRSKIVPIRDGAIIIFEMFKVRWNQMRGMYRVPSTEYRETSGGGER